MGLSLIEKTKLVMKLCEYDFSKNRALGDNELPYHQILEQVVQQGEAIIPQLLDNLGKGKFISLALGMIGTEACVRALADELLSSDWRRAEAAATGIGLSKNSDAIHLLESARDSGYHSTVAEVHSAIGWAIAELHKIQLGERWLTVDRKQPLQQIRMVSQMRSSLDEIKSKLAIQWAVEMIDILPELNVQDPDGEFSPDEAKAIAWNLLAITIYYLRNPSDRSFEHACTEAKYCWEQAIELNPKKDEYIQCLSRVSGHNHNIVDNVNESSDDEQAKPQKQLTTTVESRDAYLAPWQLAKMKEDERTLSDSPKNKRQEEEPDPKVDSAQIYLAPWQLANIDTDEITSSAPTSVRQYKVSTSTQNLKEKTPHRDSKSTSFWSRCINILPNALAIIRDAFVLHMDLDNTDLFNPEKDVFKVKKCLSRFLSKGLRVNCINCYRMFHIGRDSTVVTVEGLLADFSAAVCFGSTPHNISNNPDLVRYVTKLVTGPASQLINPWRKELLWIVNSLTRGEPRWWRCDHCQHINQYRIDIYRDFSESAYEQLPSLLKTLLKVSLQKWYDENKWYSKTSSKPFIINQTEDIWMQSFGTPLAAVAKIMSFKETNRGITWKTRNEALHVITFNSSSITPDNHFVAIKDAKNSFHILWNTPDPTNIGFSLVELLLK